MRKSLALVLLAVLSVGAAYAVPKLTLPAAETGPMNICLVQGYEFDPLEQTPNLPAEYTIDGFAGEYGYYLIQFPGPVRPEWKAAVERAGAELLWYQPEYAFIARVRNSRAAAIAALPEVRWMGLDQPGYKLLRGLENCDGPQTLIVVFYYPEDEQGLLGQIQALGATGILTEFNQWNNSVKLTIDGSRIADLARLPGVFWIEPYGDVTPDNADMSWVDQKGYASGDTSRPVWRKGVNGSSVIVGLTDSPMWTGHDLFRDPVNNTPSPTHRKIIKYNGSQGSDSHGTHTCGTLCGNDSTVGGSSWNDGLARNARVYFQNYNVFPSGWDMNVWFAGPESGTVGLRAFNHSMSLSRKDTFNQYVFSDMTADQFVWNHRKFLHCNSMGNYGTNQMGHPVAAKSIISTGATMNGVSCRSIATYTSRGPTTDGRRKPQLCTPGDNLYSASNSSANGYVAMSGTSMATPNMTAGMALIRDYFRKGFYPTGDSTTGTKTEISAALNKAVGIVGADNDVSGYTVPDNNVGWGRLDLDSSLYFAGDSSMLWVMDETLGLQTGDSAVYTVNVASPGRPLRVAMCYSDYPGTARASKIIVNDISLTTINPTGTEYKGNVWSGGQSQTGGNYDTLNVEECTRNNAPAIGTWTIKVKARNVPNGPQPYALAVIGTFGSMDRHDVGTTRILAPVGQVDSGDAVIPEAIVRNYGTFEEDFDVVFWIGTDYSDTSNMILSAGETDTVDFTEWDAEQLGWFQVRCSTMLDGDAGPANDRARDSVRVIPLSGVGEGGMVPTRFVLEKGNPNPFADQTAIRFGVPRTTEVELAIYSASGQLVRRLHSGAVRPGYYQAVWNARDDAGRLVSRGIYYCRFSSEGLTDTRKLVRVE